MISIGVTGGIGSGKSVVCSFFEQKNVPVFYSDQRAKDLLETDPAVVKTIVGSFGGDILDPVSKKIDNKKLAEKVFSEHGKTLELNSILHPLVISQFEKWKNSHRSSALLIAEAPLLFESGMDEFVDYIVAVIADDPVRVQRVRSRDHMSDDQIKTRMRLQLSNEEFTEYADFIVPNNGTVEELSSKLDFFYTLFKTLKKPEKEQ